MNVISLDARRASRSRSGALAWFWREWEFLINDHYFRGDTTVLDEMRRILGGEDGDDENLSSAGVDQIEAAARYLAQVRAADDVPTMRPSKEV